MGEAAVAADDAALVAAARGELAALLGAEGDPVFTRVNRYVKAAGDSSRQDGGVPEQIGVARALGSRRHR